MKTVPVVFLIGMGIISPSFGGAPLTLISTLRQVSGTYAEKFKYAVDKSAIKPIHLLGSSKNGTWLEGCLAECGTAGAKRVPVLSVRSGNQPLTESGQGRELLELHQFFRDRADFAGVALSLSSMRLRENAAIPVRGAPLRFGTLEADLIDAQGRATTFVVDWVLGTGFRDPTFVPKMGRPDIGYFTTYESRPGRPLIQKYSLRDFPVPVTVFGEGITAETRTALNESIQNWNRLLRDLAPNGVFSRPRYVDARAFFEREPFTSGNLGVVIELGPKPGLSYSGHTIVYSDPETNQNFGARIWINTPGVAKGAQSILARCNQAKSGAAYPAPWKSLGNCRLSEREQVTWSFRYMFTHELGHTLGLTHNLKGSLQAAPGEVSSSIMEYPHGADRPAMKLGRYDREAIAWGYYGFDPGRPMLFCEDDSSDIWDETFQVKDPQCSGDDQGADSFAYYERVWLDMIRLGMGEGGVPPRYSFEDLEPALTLSLKAFAQYYAGAEIYGSKLWNFYGRTGRPKNHVTLRTFILKTLEQPFCSAPFTGQAFMDRVRTLAQAQLNGYARLNIPVGCSSGP